jgi:hypothetical protein
MHSEVGKGSNTLGIIDQHYALIIIPLFITQASTYFGIYVLSLGCSLKMAHKCRNI